MSHAPSISRRAAERELQVARPEAQTHKGEAAQAGVAARAHNVDVQARTTADTAAAGPRAAASVVGVLKVQAEQLCLETGGCLAESSSAL